MKRLISIVALSCVIFLASCARTPEVPQNTELLRVSDQAQLARLLAPQTRTSSPFDFGFRTMAEVDSIGGDFMSTQTTQANAQSQTNVQVYGVDEGDMVKVDQRHIYRLDYQSVHVIELLAQGAMQQRFHLEAARHQYFTELYLTEDYFIVVGVRYEPYNVPERSPSEGTPSREADVDIAFGWWPQQTFTTVDVYAKETLVLQDRFEIEGQLLSTRLIENTVYLVHNHTPQFNEDEDLRPVFVHNDETSRPNYEDIAYLPSIETEAFLILSKLSISSESQAQHTTFLGNYHWGPMYVNHRGITFASHQFHVSTQRFNNRSTYHALTTLIHFAFDDERAPQFAGQAQLKGHVLDQFSIDEHEGYLRVFTTESLWNWQTTRPDTINRLYVIKHDEDADQKPILEVVSLLDEGIGKPHETIRSARFMGTIATVVTFEMIDPFYTIDLSDPYEPVIMGELEITGFSTYQHPFYDHYVLGLGFETDLRGQPIGIKLSLYDIRDPHNPIVVGEPFVLLGRDQGWQFAEALYNHKAILVSEDHQLFGFALQRVNWWSSRESYQTSEYLFFTIDPEAAEPVSLAGVIDHQALARERAAQVAAEGQEALSYHIYSSVQRAVFVQDTLYVISQLGVTSHTFEAPFDALDSLLFD